MGKLYKKISCPIDGCNRFLGDIQTGADVTVDFLCKNHKPSILVQISQSSNGILSYKQLNKSEFRQYDDDGIRVSDE